MRKRTEFVLIALLLFSANMRAAETVVWQGSKQFQDWTDVVNIDGNKFRQTNTDDVLRLSITAGEGAQLQMSYGSDWTNFDGLGSLPIKGDYEMMMTSQTIGLLKQGIHIKGVNYTLTAVTLVRNDGKYTTASEELFGWRHMLTSGATRGESSSIGMMAYGGAGWYWHEGADMGDMGSVAVKLLQPAAETIIVQLLYDDSGVERLQIEKDGTSCMIPLSAKHNKVYSVNLMSQKSQTISLASVNLLDKRGNPVSTGINPVISEAQDASPEYYSLSGIRLNGPKPGINIIKTKTNGGGVISRKIIR